MRRVCAKSYLAGLIFLCAASSIFGQARVTGTFKLPSGQTPAQGGVKILTTVNGVNAYGTVDFTPTDPTGNTALRLLCNGVTVIPVTVRGWIAADGSLIDVAAVPGVPLTPTVGCDPVGAAYRARVDLNRTVTAGETIYSEVKQIPDNPAVDWGTLSVAALSTPAYARTGTVSMTLETPATADSGKFQWKPGGNFVLTKVSCSVDSGSASINLEQRSKSAPNNSGFATLSTPLACGTTGAESSNFAATNLTANDLLALDVLSVSGAPGIVRVFVDYRQVP